MSTLLSKSKTRIVVTDYGYDYYSIVSTGCLRDKTLCITRAYNLRETYRINSCSCFGGGVYGSVYTLLR